MRCSTAELSAHRLAPLRSVRVEGIEPSASSLSEKRSANELHARRLAPFLNEIKETLVPYHKQKHALSKGCVFVS